MGISDITPKHDPLTLARDMVRVAPGCAAGLYVLIERDGKVTYDMAGHQRAFILWGLQRMMHELMSEE